MSFINYMAGEINCKIVYYGPGLCGKTTNLQYVYERTNPDAKGRMVSLATETERTLFFDFLPLTLGEIRGFRTRFHLYSVPGQVFYDASRKLILKGVDGIVFVADSQAERIEANTESLANLRGNLAEQGYSFDALPLVVQYNKRDSPHALSVSELARALNPMGAPEFEANARSGVGVFETLKCISKLVLNELKQNGGGVSPGAPMPTTRPPPAIADTIPPAASDTLPPGASDTIPPAASATLPPAPPDAIPSVVSEAPTEPAPLVAMEPFANLAPSDVSKALALVLNSRSERIPDQPFPSFWQHFPGTFPLGLARCVFAFPPREFTGKIVLDRLAGHEGVSSGPKVIFSRDERQRGELAALIPFSDQAAAVIDPFELKRIINEEDSPVEFARFLSRHMSVGSISPYALTSGVNNDMLFFGRRHLLDRILSRRGTNYALIGGRRLGKTALLQAIERRCHSHGIDAVYVSLTGDDLVEQLAVKLGLPEDSDMKALVRSLRKGAYRLLLIDEADEFVRSESERQFTTLRQVHSLSAAQSCNFVFAGFWNLFHACKRDYLSPMFNFAETIRIGPLETQAARDLLTKPMANLDVAYEQPEVIDELATLTGGRANLLTRACRDILYHIDRRRTITRDDLAAVLASTDFRQELEAWKTLSGLPLTLTVARANHLDRVVILATAEKACFTQSELLAELLARGVSATREEIDDSLSRLELDYILRRDADTFAYAIPMFRKILAEQDTAMALEQELAGFEDGFALNAGTQ